MVDYKKGIIYTIRSQNNLYVGSTCDFTKRKYDHKNRLYNKNNNGFSCNVYKKIRDNNYEWDMKPYKIFPCKNKTELIIEEEKVRIELKADLNSNKAFLTEEEMKKRDKINTIKWKDNNKANIKIYNKEYREKFKDKIKETSKEKNKEKIICECGCEVTKINLKRHKKTPKHINLM